MLKEIKIKEINSIIASSDDKVCIEAKLDKYLSEEEMFDLMKANDKKIVFQKAILDDEERKYLKEVVRPFRDRVDYISKSKFNPFGDECYIEISIDNRDDCVCLPNFDEEDMYIGMEIDREYSLEELGL